MQFSKQKVLIRDRNLSAYIKHLPSNLYSLISLQILYDDGYDGIVAGFVWQHMTYLDGDTWEHPDNMAVGAIIDRPPQCVWDVVESPGLSTMHHYFWEYPLLIGCF